MRWCWALIQKSHSCHKINHFICNISAVKKSKAIYKIAWWPQPKSISLNILRILRWYLVLILVRKLKSLLKQKSNSNFKWVIKPSLTFKLCSRRWNPGCAYSSKILSKILLDKNCRYSLNSQVFRIRQALLYQKMSFYL